MTEGVFTTADGCRLAFVDAGEGLPVLWQHGLGADRAQPAEVFPDDLPVRRLTLECRGHGASDLGEEREISIAGFTADVLALMDHLRVERAVVGGISLGAAIALRLAVRHPDRVAGLILARPAWIDGDGPAPLRIYREVAEAIERFGYGEGRRHFEQSSLLAEVEAESPDNAASLRSFFDPVRSDRVVPLLMRIPADGTGVTRDDIGLIATPTLVIANGRDYVHPLATARALAGLIRGAAFVQITSKTVSRERYVAEFRAALRAFLSAQCATA